jgi:outer membrane murein-binding lipoprotein Lpp
MRDPTVNGEAEIAETVPTPEAGRSKSGEQLDKAGQSILRLLHKAAGVTEQKNQRARQMAQKLSDQARAAESRVAELQAEVKASRERAERAEQWLHRVYTEIEDRFFQQGR